MPPAARLGILWSLRSPEERGRELEDTLQECIALLRRHAEPWWVPQLENVLRLIRARDAAGLERLLGMFGGMGSFNDLTVCRMNGHRIDAAEETPVRKALDTCRSRLYELASELLRETP